MTRKPPAPAAVSAGFFVAVVLPFVIPMLVTLALMLSVGESWPRQIAPGSSLKLAGFLTTAITALAVFAGVTAKHRDARLRKGTALLCAITGLMGWPVWSMGVLPSVNGSALGDAQAVPMVLERTEVTAASRSAIRYHWAWLRPVSGPDAALLAAGRYFISDTDYDRWNAENRNRVTVLTARGRLGAVVVTGFEQDSGA